MKINVFDLIGEYAVTAEDGQKLYNQIHPELLSGSEVVLDFANVRIFCAAFCNYGLGQLLRDIPPETINQLLVFDNLAGHGWEVIKLVMKNARNYYVK